MNYDGLSFGQRVYCNIIVDATVTLQHLEPRSSTPVDPNLSVLAFNVDDWGIENIEKDNEQQYFESDYYYSENEDDEDLVSPTIHFYVLT